MTRSDVLTDLLSELRARFAPGADVREVEVYLASRGYDARQIGEILAVFAMHPESEPDRPADAASANAPAPRPEGPVFRVMGAYERSRFSVEAWGQLLVLVAAGTLSPMDREQVIERALMQTDGRIGLAELRALLEGAGIDAGGSAGTLTIH